MKSEKLELNHRELLFDRLKQVDTKISEYSFANLFLFRNNHKYNVVFDDEIFIEGVTYDDKKYIMPTAEVSKIDKNYLKSIAKNYDFIFPIDEKWLNYFDEDFEFTFRDGDTDYIYTVEKISTLKGRKLHKKRNLLKQFITSYEYESRPLLKEYLQDANDILDVWLADIEELPEKTDYFQCKEALNLMDELSVCGIIYYADDEPAGFVLGEEIDEETFVLHFAKGKRKFKGVYQFIYNDFAKRLPKKYKLLNFEQDLGKMALRVAKSSYVPDFMYKKYRVSLK
ncbi:DUF2156 domain-containing protein [Deferribacteraceae bacterium V6Fe1]|jgi:hypothetical protein|uniref:DUF2156 domain-containing protein n=1 Tax=Deferrivibrio essentukiensis TaxID=2880922 RepID=UPI001F605C91|nr:phosphatidylglycerol lysyltransferase domain-containing protein [Deferrivibrio essentukiensis]MCB4205483.1 phosphatidylglycerol lysyltransferase domain-containing protein [Deferrivibrio essentukiensis]UOD34702.1 DUF2156 domain-containing protein [Deferribacteraceae bacterium V6Fe1]